MQDDDKEWIERQNKRIAHVIWTIAISALTAVIATLLTIE